MKELLEIENLLKTGEKDNVDLAVAMMEGLPEIYKKLRQKWQPLNCQKQRAYYNRDEDYTSLFSSPKFAFIIRYWKNYFQRIGDLFNRLFELQHLQELDFSASPLRFLDIKGLDLSGISRLKNIKKLTFWECRISELPKELGEIKRLEVLDIGFTKIQALPSSMRNTQIDRLCIQGSAIKHPVDFFAEWENIQTMLYTNHEKKVAELKR